MISFYIYIRRENIVPDDAYLYFDSQLWARLKKNILYSTSNDSREFDCAFLLLFNSRCVTSEIFFSFNSLYEFLFVIYSTLRCTFNDLFKKNQKIKSDALFMFIFKLVIISGSWIFIEFQKFSWKITGWIKYIISFLEYYI